MGKAVNMMIFRVGPPDGKLIETYTKPGFGAPILQALPDFHAVGRFLLNNYPVNPFVFKSSPAVSPVTDWPKLKQKLEALKKTCTIPVKTAGETILERRKQSPKV